jgi:putative transposase
MLGRLKTFESTNKLTSRIEAGTARISRATLAYERGRWVVSFTVHQTIDVTPGVHTVIRPVGIDFGVKDLLVVADADGHEFERIRAPRHLAEAQRRLRALQRRAARQTGPYDSVTRKRQEASARWRRTQERITRAHARVASLREDALHQATSKIAATYSHVVIEDLAVKAMSTRGGARKRGLNRALADAAFGKLAWMLTYKTGWNGGTLTRANRWFPSSKTCSDCGAVKAKLTLSERTHTCIHCGARIDRDLNAAINLARLSESSDGVPARNASGATRKTTPRVAVGRETGTHTGGSATPQGEAA